MLALTAMKPANRASILKLAKNPDSIITVPVIIDGFLYNQSTEAAEDRENMAAVTSRVTNVNYNRISHYSHKSAVIHCHSVSVRYVR